MKNHGITFTGQIVPDTNNIQRFHVEGDRPGTKNGYYRLHTDGIPAGIFGAWNNPEASYTWCAKSDNTMTDTEREALRKKIEGCNRQRNVEIQRRQSIAAKEAKRIWDLAEPIANANSIEYLARKKIQSYGLRQLICDVEYEVYPEKHDNNGRKKIHKLYKGNTLVPCYFNGEIVNLESIYYSQKTNRFEKRPLTGGLRTGAYHMIGKATETSKVICLVEGYATGATISEATGTPTFVTFNCGNMLAVAQTLRTNYPLSTLVIITDDDRWHTDSKLRNAGLKVAKNACKKVSNTTYVLPNFNALNVSAEELIALEPTDFNDLFVHLLANGFDREAALLEIKQQITKHLTTHEDNFMTNEEKQQTNGNQSKKSDPQPLPEALPKVLPFDIDMLPEPIKGYVQDIAQRQQCPIDFVAVTAMCGLASVLGNKISMKPKQHDDWCVVPNLWGAIIGRPSAMKSPSMKEALKPLSMIDAEASKQYKIDKEEYDLNKELSELNKSSAKEKAKKHIKAGKEAEAKSTLKEASFSEQPPTRKRIIVNDATVEKLGELLNENPNGLILVRDELYGWLAKLAREEHQSDRAFYLECYDGNGQYVYDRIGRGTIDINSTTLSVIGGIQPSRISPLVRDAIRGTVDDGLIQRLQLAVWPDDITSWQWNDKAPNYEVKNRYYGTFADLHSLDVDSKPCHLKFSKNAQLLFIEWFKEIQEIARSDDTHPALESHLLKMPKTVATLALLFELIEGGTQSVGEKAIAMALDWADYLTSHAERIYSVAKNHGIAGARLILKRKQSLPEIITTRTVQRKGWAGLTEIEAIADSLECLVDYGYLISKEIPPTIRGGRATMHYSWN